MCLCYNNSLHRILWRGTRFALHDPSSLSPGKQHASHDGSYSPLPAAGEGQYSLKYGEVGTKVAIVSSEPITGSSDWVSVPRNTALIISKGKNGYVSILKSPLASSGKHPRQEEVLRCLEAVTSAAEVEGQALPFNRHKRRRIAQSHGGLPAPASPTLKPSVLSIGTRQVRGSNAGIVCCSLL